MLIVFIGPVSKDNKPLLKVGDKFKVSFVAAAEEYDERADDDLYSLNSDESAKDPQAWRLYGC